MNNFYKEIIEELSNVSKTSRYVDTNTFAYKNLISMGGFIEKCCMEKALSKSGVKAYTYITGKYPGETTAFETARYLSYHIGEFENGLKRYQRNLEEPSFNDVKLDCEKFLKRYIELNCDYIFNSKKANIIREICDKTPITQLTPFENAFLICLKKQEECDFSMIEVIKNLGLKEKDYAFLQAIEWILDDWYKQHYYELRSLKFD